MPSIKLDLSKFRHLKSDKDTATLQHKDGHVLTIATKALSPEFQKQLGALTNISKDAETPADKEEMKTKMADGGPVHGPCLNPNCKSHGMPHPNCRCYANGGMVGKGCRCCAEGGKVEQTKKDKPTGGTLDYTNFGKEFNDKSRQYQIEDRAKPKKRAMLAQGDDPENAPVEVPGSEHSLPTDQYGLPPKDEGRTDWNQYAVRAAKPDTSTLKAAKILVDNHGTDSGPMPPPASPAPASKEPNRQVSAADMEPAVEGNPDNDPENTPPDISAQGATSTKVYPSIDSEGNQVPDGAVPPTSTPQAGAASAQPDAQAAQQPQASEAPPPPVDPKAQIQQHLTEQDAAWQHDLQNGHITPQTYQSLFANKNTLGKVGTLFGLLVSGFGAGVTGKENAVMELMNNQIKQDLEAQKSSKDNAQNYLRINMQHQLNDAQIKKMQQEGTLNTAQAKAVNIEALTKAVTLSQMQMNRAALHNLTVQASQLPPGSKERLAADQQLAILNSSIQNENFGLADRAATAGAYSRLLFGQPSGGGEGQEQAFQKQTSGLKMLGPQGETRAKDLEEKHMPGIPGQASGTLTSDDRTNITDGVTFQKQLNNFMNWTSKHSGSLSPTEIKEGHALAADLQGAYRRATKGGVYKSGEQDFISSIIDSDPTKFFNQIRVMPSLKAVSNDSSMQLDQFLKAKGFQGYPGASQNDTQSDPVRGKDGRLYRRQGNFMVPVQ